MHAYILLQPAAPWEASYFGRACTHDSGSGSGSLLLTGRNVVEKNLSVAPWFVSNPLCLLEDCQGGCGSGCFACVLCLPMEFVGRVVDVLSTLVVIVARFLMSIIGKIAYQDRRLEKHAIREDSYCISNITYVSQSTP